MPDLSNLRSSKPMSIVFASTWHHMTVRKASQLFQYFWLASFELVGRVSGQFAVGAVVLALSIVSLAPWVRTLPVDALPSALRPDAVSSCLDGLQLGAAELSRALGEGGPGGGARGGGEAADGAVLLAAHHAEVQRWNLWPVSSERYLVVSIAFLAAVSPSCLGPLMLLLPPQAAFTLYKLCKERLLISDGQKTVLSNTKTPLPFNLLRHNEWMKQTMIVCFN